MNCRVFVKKEDISEVPGSSITLSGDEARYITEILRLKPGEEVTLCSVGGMEYACTVKESGRNRVNLAVISAETVNRESPLNITLCQALPKGRKMDLIIQKGTELGVRHFIPFVTSRSVSRPGEREAVEKVRRWERIALEASRQCGRNFIPPVEGIVSFGEMLQIFTGADDNKTIRMIFWEGEEQRGIKTAGKTYEEKSSLSPEGVQMLIGPEGGFSAEEVETAKRAGFVPVSLGRRLLRTETAGLAAVSMIQFLWGDLG